jgi:hypothetical protein
MTLSGILTTWKLNIVPELQDIAVGTIFPALPGVGDAFRILALDRERALILGWASPDGTPLTTWAFVLEERADDATRLIVRVRAGTGYQFHGLPWWLTKRIVPVVHFIMQRKQLLGIARRVELSRVNIGTTGPTSTGKNEAA